MTSQEVADKFMEMANHGKYKEIQDQLYAENWVIIEPANSPGLNNVEGLNAKRKRAKNLMKQLKKCMADIQAIQ